MREEEGRVQGRLQQELTRSQAQCQELEDCRISLRYFIATVNSGNLVSFQTLIGFFLKKSFWYGRLFFFSVDVQNRGLGSGSL